MFSWQKCGKDVQLTKVWQKCSVGKSVAKRFSWSKCGKKVQLAKVWQKGSVGKSVAKSLVGKSVAKMLSWLSVANMASYDHYDSLYICKQYLLMLK